MIEQGDFLAQEQKTVGTVFGSHRSYEMRHIVDLFCASSLLSILTASHLSLRKSCSFNTLCCPKVVPPSTSMRNTCSSSFTILTKHATYTSPAKS
jgi:hypothetical protein